MNRGGEFQSFPAKHAKNCDRQGITKDDCRPLSKKLIITRTLYKVLDTHLEVPITEHVKDLGDA